MIQKASPSAGEIQEFHNVKHRTPKSKREVFFLNLKRDKYLYVMLIPLLTVYVLFHYKPMYGILIAFKDYTPFRGFANSPWVGFKHFTNFFSAPDFLILLRNTFLLSFYGLLFGYPIPIILALMFNEVSSKSFKKLTQTLTYLPHFISSVVIVGIVVNFLSPSTGLINHIIEFFGGTRQYFLIKAEWFRTIFVSMNIWKEAGFGTIMFISALGSIDQELYNAAAIDGAGKWKQTLNVTIPGLLPTIVITLILRVGSLLSVGYETVILLYQPVTYETADVISSYVYRISMTENQWSLGTAVSLFESLVALVLVVFTNKISKLVSETSLW
jgi:putative aldouronate transport system permease protein